MNSRTDYLQRCGLLNRVLITARHLFSLPAILAWSIFFVVAGSYSASRAQTGAMYMKYLRIDASNFPEIISDVTLWDGTNAPVTGLTENNFAVYEDNAFQAPIVVEYFGDDSIGVSVVLVIDHSGSMREELGDAKAAAVTFASLLHDYDSGALVIFDNQVTVVQPFTSNRQVLIDAINSVRLGNGTAVYDGVLEAIDLLKTRSGKKAVVVLSDGRDNSSDATLDFTLNLVESVGIPVYTIGLGLKAGKGDWQLQAIATRSGGEFYETPSSKELEAIYRHIALLLTDQFYRIHYNTLNCQRDGTRREVRIEAQSQGFAASDTSSYIAPNYNVDFTLSATPLIAPGQTFNLRLNVPPSSMALQDFANLSFTIKYDPQYLEIDKPVEQNIVPNNAFGTTADYSINYSIDEVAGTIAIDLARSPGAAAINIHGAVMKLIFVAEVSTPDSTRLEFELQNLDLQDRSGCSQIVRSKNLVAYSSGMIVWPGDTNHNGRVELSDALVLGVYWNISGPRRKISENILEWKPQLAQKFSIRAATHADCDGNGRVSERDVIPIGVNWAKTPSDYKGGYSPKAAAAPPEGALSVRIAPDKVPGQYRLSLWVDRSNSAPLAGITLRMQAGGDKLTVLSARPGALWPEQPLFFVHNDAQEQSLALGLMLPAGSAMPESGGELVQILLQAKQPPTASDVAFEDIALVGASGATFETAVAAQDVAIAANAAPDGFKLFAAYPNPFNPRTTVQFYLPETAHAEAVIFDIAGREVRRYSMQSLQSGFHSLQWDGRDTFGRSVGSGFYFIRLAATTADGRRFSAKQKLSLVK